MPASAARLVRAPAKTTRRGGKTTARTARKGGTAPARSRARTPARATHTRRVEFGIAARAQLTRRNLFAGIFLASVLFLHAWTGLRVGELSYELARAHEVQARLDREKQELKVRLTSATAPDRLEALASERLGMRPPKPGQVVMLR